MNKILVAHGLVAILATQVFGESPKSKDSNAHEEKAFPPKVVDKATSVGLEGYCPVTLTDCRDPKRAWQRGDVKFSVQFHGRVYYCVGLKEMDQFMLSPERYAAALSCFDIVAFANETKLIDGKRRHGVSYRGQVYLFANEENLKTFWAEPKRYADLAREKHPEIAGKFKNSFAPMQNSGQVIRGQN